MARKLHKMAKKKKEDSEKPMTPEIIFLYLHPQSGD